MDETHSIDSSRAMIHGESGLLATEMASGDLELVLAAQGFRTIASGEIAQDIRSLLRGGSASARLVAMAKLLPWLRTITEIEGPARPLEASQTLAGSGFGLLFLEVTGNCNERCTHCYAEAGPSVRASLSKAQIFRIIDDAAKLGFETVQFTGGDPLLCKFLDECAARAFELGLAIEVYTNGLLLTDKRLASLVPYRPAFAFSVYSHVPELHDLVTRTPGSLKRTLAAIERAVKSGLPTRVGLVAMKSNHRQLPKTVQMLRDLGVSNVHVTPSFEVGRGEQYQGLLPEGVQQSHGGDVENRVQKSKLCITYEAKVVPCIFNRTQVLGTISDERGLADIVAKPRLAKSSDSLDVFLQNCSSQLQCSDCRTTAASLYLLGARS